MNNDPLNRPVAEYLIPKATAAGDLILASFKQRFAAFIIDLIIIASIFCTIIFVFANNYVQASSIMTHLTTLYAIWGVYVVGCSTSKISATIGQSLIRIHLYSLFTGGINFNTALIRFILISYPCAIAIFPASNLLSEIFLPASFVANNNDDNMNYTILVIAGLVQIFLLLPLLSGNYRNISWDKTLRCCVIRRKIY